MSNDPPEYDPFNGVPPWLIVLLTRKILSAMMFPRPEGDYYSVNELARNLNFAFERTPFGGEGRPNRFTFTAEKLRRMFDYLKRTTFPVDRVELSNMVSRIRRWPQNCGEQDLIHPSYVVNKYITYGYVLTPNQCDAWAEVPFEEEERLEALQFVHYHLCTHEGLAEPEILETVFDCGKLMWAIRGVLSRAEYNPYLNQLAQDRSSVPDFEDYAAPHIHSRIERAAFPDEASRVEAENRRAAFFARTPVINGH